MVKRHSFCYMLETQCYFLINSFLLLLPTDVLPAIKPWGVIQLVKGLKTGKKLSAEFPCFNKEQMLCPDGDSQSIKSGFHCQKSK